VTATVAVGGGSRGLRGGDGLVPDALTIDSVNCKCPNCKKELVADRATMIIQTKEPVAAA